MQICSSSGFDDRLFWIVSCRGQLLHGRKAAGEGLRWSEKKLRNMPVQCESIQLERNTKDSVVTVVNWGAYQVEPYEKRNDLGPTEESVADRMAEEIATLWIEKKANKGPTKGQPRANRRPAKGRPRASKGPTKGHKQECKEC